MRLLVCFFTFFISGFQVSFALSDIENSWYRSFIEESLEKGHIKGYSDNSFKPEVNITREEFLKILLQTSKQKISEELGENCFSDISDEMWSKKYICTGKSLGIVSGYEDGTFRPYTTITTVEALALTARTLEFEVTKNNQEWFEEYRIFFDEKNIFEGYLFTKNTLLSRGQSAELLIRATHYRQKSIPENITIGCKLTESLPDSGIIEVVGKTRKYILSLPSGYTGTQSYPLIFGIHGRTNSNAMVQDYMKLEKYPQGAIVVYPAGLGTGPYSWHQSENIDYFDALLAKLSENYCIKRDKVFVVGHSLGGYMTYKLGCLRGNLIRAISVVGGASYAGNCEYPVATQILHRPDDYLVTYSQGEAMLSQFQEVNLCSSENKRGSYGNAAGKTYSCSSENPIFFSSDYATYGDDPHSWPKGGSDFAFEFFESLK